MHLRIIGIAVLVCSIATIAFAVEPVVTATHGTITKIDEAAKTFAVRTAEGTEHIFYWAKDTSVHGIKATDVAATDSWHGLKEGSEVVAHSTKRGAKDTAVEVDKVGDTGLKRTEGTIKEVDRNGKKLVIESADGTEHAFTLTTHAADDAGKDLAARAEKRHESRHLFHRGCGQEGRALFRQTLEMNLRHNAAEVNFLLHLGSCSRVTCSSAVRR